MAMSAEEAFVQAVAVSEQYTKETVKGAGALKGLGVKSTHIDANNHLIVTYDDDTTEDAGEYDGVSSDEFAQYKSNAGRYNVLDYGLVGDGATDNTEALIDMITTVPEGSVIYFPKGTYNISDTIEINKSMSFIGDTIHNQIHNFETSLSDSIINYSGSKANVTLFKRTRWRGVFFKGLTFKGNAFTCTVNPNRSEVIPKPMRVDDVIIEGISAIDLHDIDAWTTVSDCLFHGFSGFGVKVGQHKFIINCGFHSCNDAIQAGFDSFVENSWIACCHNAIRSVKTADQEAERGDDSFTSVGISDTWADQLSGHFYVADWELGSVTCLMDNIIIDLVDESVFYMPNGQLMGGRIQGYINRYGMACEGIEESEKTAELLPKSCCIYAVMGAKINLDITTVDSSTPSDARKLIECPTSSEGLFMAPVTITCPNRSFDKIFGANCHFQNDKKDGYNIYSKEGHSIYYRSFWYTEDRTSYEWGALHNMLAPAIGVYCLNTRTNKWYMSTKADDREAWIPVEAPSLSNLTDTSISTPQSGDVLVYDGEKWENEGVEEAVNPYSDLAFTLNEKGYVSAGQSQVVATQGAQWKYSDPIAVSAGQHIKFTASGFTVNVAMISTCDENGDNISVKIISEMNPDESDYWYRDYEYDVMADGYIIVSCNIQGGTPILKVKNTPITFNNIILTNVFKGICHSFKKVLCVGDSYTQGLLFKYSDATSIIAPQYSWVQHMNTLTGNEWINCGISGATSKTWQSNSDGLAKAQSEGAAQAYIIGLGINDSNSDNINYLPVGAISDIGTNNDTYYAQLSKVIVELATINPDAYIFVNTCPFVLRDRIAPYNVAIKNIVEHFKDTYKIHCIDLAGYYSDLFYSPDFMGLFYRNHPTVEGHATIAKMYEFALSDYMRQNEVAFRNIPWTSYDT